MFRRFLLRQNFLASTVGWSLTGRWRRVARGSVTPTARTFLWTHLCSAYTIKSGIKLIFVYQLCKCFLQAMLRASVWPLGKADETLESGWGGKDSFRNDLDLFTRWTQFLFFNVWFPMNRILFSWDGHGRWRVGAYEPHQSQISQHFIPADLSAMPALIGRRARIGSSREYTLIALFYNG